MTAFDESLWARLVDEHDAHLVALGPVAQQTNKRRLVLGGGVVALAATSAAAVLAVNAATSASPAYALTQHADGSVTVTIHELSTAVPQLNAKFAEMGVHETVVPVQANCPASREFRLHAYPSLHMTDTWTFMPGGADLTPGWMGVLAAEQLPNGEVAIAQMAVKPPVPSCFSNVAYTPPQPTGTTTHGIPMVTQTPINPATPAQPGG